MNTFEPIGIKVTLPNRKKQMLKLCSYLRDISFGIVLILKLTGLVSWSWLWIFGIFGLLSFLLGIAVGVFNYKQRKK